MTSFSQQFNLDFVVVKFKEFVLDKSRPQQSGLNVILITMVGQLD